MAAFGGPAARPGRYRHGLGHYPGRVAEPLLAPESLPAPAHTLLAAGEPIREPVDCLAWPLLQDADRAD
ncbi:hypothetical protein [Pseudomonas piscis]|uniref:hypothetical protein n=1 Tax=Pseudomonas piscis TaxID=2614538 RepID=UPI0021D5959E|nr:hypothetical protein [Pseudomonas piscis]MCU7646466.1 hypothetical protein [Pseudomonas piscis]